MLYIDHRGDIALELALLIGQSIPVELTDLNSKGLPDTFYLGIDGESHGSEIKQPGEVLGSLSNVEEQLAREYNGVDHLSLLIAGVVIPAETGTKTLSWYADGSGARVTGIRGGGFYKTSYPAYRAWVESVERWGIRVIEVPNKVALATHLVAMYEWDQKFPQEHHTFRRTLKPRIPITDGSPLVKSLMGICDRDTGRTFTGEAIATALERECGTLKGVVTTSAQELAEIRLGSGRRVGTAWVEKFERSVGNANG